MKIFLKGRNSQGARRVLQLAVQLALGDSWSVEPLITAEGNQAILPTPFHSSQRSSSKSVQCCRHPTKDGRGSPNKVLIPTIPGVLDTAWSRLWETPSLCAGVIHHQFFISSLGTLLLSCPAGKSAFDDEKGRKWLSTSVNSS